MNPDTTLSVSLLISVASITLAIVSAIRNKKNDEVASKAREAEHLRQENARQLDIEKNFVKINSKLDDFKDNVQTIMKENGKKTDELKDVTEQLILANQQIKQLFRYHDDHEARIKDLEHNK